MDAVVHMAALLHIVNPPPELREKYERVNIGGTATVVEAAIKEGVKRVVLSPTHPDTFYAQTKRAAEQIVLNARGAEGQPLGTVLRLGAVYGSRIKGNYQRLVRSLARGRFSPVGKGANRRSLVYDKDVARAAVLAATHDAAAGKIFNVSDGCFHTLNEIIETICDALGRRPPGFALPVSPVRRAAGLMEDGAHLFGLQAPVTRATIDKYTEDIAVDSRRIRDELGFVPQYDLAAGWQETVGEMRQQNNLTY